MFRIDGFYLVLRSNIGSMSLSFRVIAKKLNFGLKDSEMTRKSGNKIKIFNLYNDIIHNLHSPDSRQIP